MKDVGKAEPYRTVQRQSRRKAMANKPEEGLVERTATANKSMRVTWNDRRTILSISFLPKSEVTSQIVVQHGKLPDSKAAAKMKKYWAEALDRLRALLENKRAPYAKLSQYLTTPARDPRL